MRSSACCLHAWRTWEGNVPRIRVRVAAFIDQVPSWFFTNADALCSSCKVKLSLARSDSKFSNSGMRPKSIGCVSAISPCSVHRFRDVAPRWSRSTGTSQSFRKQRSITRSWPSSVLNPGTTLDEVSRDKAFQGSVARPADLKGGAGCAADGDEIRRVQRSLKSPSAWECLMWSKNIPHSIFKSLQTNISRRFAWSYRSVLLQSSASAARWVSGLARNQLENVMSFMGNWRKSSVCLLTDIPSEASKGDHTAWNYHRGARVPGWLRKRCREACSIVFQPIANGEVCEIPYLCVAQSLVQAAEASWRVFAWGGALRMYRTGFVWDTRSLRLLDEFGVHSDRFLQVRQHS